MFLYELFECNDASFFVSVHYPVGFEVDVSVRFDVKLTFVHAVIGYECALYVEVLVLLHWGDKAEVFDVDVHVAGSFVCIGDGAVNVFFCMENGDCWGSWVSGIVKAVTSSGHADEEGFYFL